ncbi:DNA-3-methyladenine glycosylase I [Granulosicoccus antarcticus]|nr:DNA-3-methyladenine glycosylase I [Granulosicoccus antarcticus]
MNVAHIIYAVLPIAESTSSTREIWTETMTDSVGCPLPVNDPVFQHYHDTEWGHPIDCDQLFFEKVCLEGFQSGLSWRTILHRRPAFREVFKGFDISLVAQFTDTDVDRLMQDARIIRNRRKIRSTINNAQCALALQDEVGSIAGFFWQFEPPAAQRPACVTRDWLEVNPTSIESTALSQALKRRGWSFVGPTTMYALMQALGIVNDHVSDCHCRQPVEQARKTFKRPLCDPQSLECQHAEPTAQATILDV